MALKSELEENPYEPPIEEEVLESAYEYRDRFESDEDFRESLAVWPRCPECGRRRITRCPICKTSGDLFPLGDGDFWNVRQAPNAQEPADGCACGNGGCGNGCHNRHDEALYNEAETPAALDGEIFPGLPSPRRLDKRHEKTSDVFDALPDRRQRVTSWSDVDAARGEKKESEGDADSERQSATVAVCHVCSEAFVPQFPRRCEWCGYDFGEGVDDENFAADGSDSGVDEYLARKNAEPNEDAEANLNRVVITLGALGLVVVILILLFCRAM